MYTLCRIRTQYTDMRVCVTSGCGCLCTKIGGGGLIFT